jgi:hypothetical protein
MSQRASCAEVVPLPKAIDISVVLPWLKCGGGGEGIWGKRKVKFCGGEKIKLPCLKNDEAEAAGFYFQSDVVDIRRAL